MDATMLTQLCANPRRSLVDDLLSWTSVKVRDYPPAVAHKPGSRAGAEHGALARSARWRRSPAARARQPGKGGLTT